ncbi:MAG: ATP-binding cassette domain-containing protein [Ruminococcaceae bacterium]|nr:ATP-binding cassette domain-containing protein [Oscillospiraceae bacterium]
MIKCVDLTKTYGNITVLEGFNYTFGDSGFYLLLGESGSGKTTLINLLSGMIPFDSGVITVGKTDFVSRVDPNTFGGGMDYITQDPYFIDYLTVKDNLKVALDDEDKINQVLEKFGLTAQKDLLPTVISGGERQRLSLARALLTRKSVMFLDEPTAALDGENKEKVFECIKELSKTALVICASHDTAAEKYADNIITFEKHTRKAEKKEKTDSVPAYPIKSGEKKKNLLKYLSGWFSSQRRGKKTDILLTVFLTLAMLMCMMADTPQGKLNANIEHVYKINALRFFTKSRDAEYFTSLVGQHGIIDIMMDYNGSVPYAPYADEEFNKVYEDILYTLPFDKETFRLSDRLAVGTWFEEKYDIILYAEMAELLAPGNWESLIGTTIPVKIYSLGQVDMRIVGVMDRLNDFEKQYMRSIDTNIADKASYVPENYLNLFFINSLVTDDMIYDENCYYFGQREYYLFFDSYESLREFTKTYDKDYGIIYEPPLSVGVEEGSQILAVISLPLAFLILLISVLFYANIIGTELAYNSGFISAFNYAGYGIKDIVRGFALLNSARLAVICLISAGISFGIAQIVNYINYRNVFVGFRIFTFSPLMITLFIAVLCISAAVSINVFLRRAKARTWYESIITSRDLL